MVLLLFELGNAIWYRIWKWWYDIKTFGHKQSKNKVILCDRWIKCRSGFLGQIIIVKLMICDIISQNSSIILSGQSDLFFDLWSQVGFISFMSTSVNWYLYPYHSLIPCLLDPLPLAKSFAHPQRLLLLSNGRGPREQADVFKQQAQAVKITKARNRAANTKQTGASSLSPHSPSPAFFILLSLYTACFMKVIPGRLAQLDVVNICLCPYFCVGFFGKGSKLIVVTVTGGGEMHVASAWPLDSQPEILFHV